MVHLKINLKLYILIAGLQIVYIPGTWRYCHAWKVWHTLTEKKFSMLQHFDCPNKRKKHISFFQLKMSNFLSEMMSGLLISTKLRPPLNAWHVQQYSWMYSRLNGTLILLNAIRWSLTSTIYVYTYFFAQFVKGQSEYHLLAKFRGSWEQKPILYSFISLQNSIHCNFKTGLVQIFKFETPWKIKVKYNRVLM